MADLFISYAREDRDTAQQLALALEQAGLSVWWDRQLAGGSDFTRVIADNLAAARQVLVLWSASSVQSAFVRDESARALKVGKLLPVRIEAADLPLGFGQIHTLDLLDWDGDTDDPGLQALLAEVRGALASGPRPRSAPVVSRLNWRRWRWGRLAWGALLLLLLAGAYAGWQWLRAGNAESSFQQGLEAQFAREANLESARNHYLSALEIRPRHARAHYYLGHVYAQLRLLDDARDSFQAAVSLARGLDAGQIRDARRQLSALTVADEPDPVARMAGPSGGEGTGPEAVVVAPPPAPMPEPPTDPTGPGPSPVIVVPQAGSQTQTPIRVPIRIPARPSAPVASSRPFMLSANAGVVSLAGLPHVAAAADRMARLQPLVAQMFDPFREKRVSATTSLIVDVELVSDALPLALDRAMKAQGARHANDADLAAARSGVINTLVLLRAASTITLRKHAGDIRRLLEMAQGNGPQTIELVEQVARLVDVAQKKRPVAWIQIADEAQRKLAERLAERLRQAGYDAPGIENVGAKAPARQSELRTQGNSDQGLARWQSLVMGSVDGLAPKMRVLRKASPKVDSYEIWLDRKVCVERRLPECS